jgi:hypothetical protein
MHTRAYIALGIFFILGVRALAKKWLERQLYTINKALFYRNLLIDRMERLDRWQQVRPFIFRGYCSYARSLVLDMIEAYEFLLNHQYEQDRELLYSLRRLLIEFPPDYDPPTTGGSLFVLKGIYAKIDALRKGSWAFKPHAGVV